MAKINFHQRVEFQLVGETRHTILLPGEEMVLPLKTLRSKTKCCELVLETREKKQQNVARRTNAEYNGLVDPSHYLKVLKGYIHIIYIYCMKVLVIKNMC